MEDMPETQPQTYAQCLGNPARRKSGIPPAIAVNPPGEQADEKQRRVADPMPTSSLFVPNKLLENGSSVRKCDICKAVEVSQTAGDLWSISRTSFTAARRGNLDLIGQFFKEFN